MGALKPDPTQVPLRRGPEVLLERVPQGKDGHVRPRSDFLYRYRPQARASMNSVARSTVADATQPGPAR